MSSSFLTRKFRRRKKQGGKRSIVVNSNNSNNSNNTNNSSTMVSLPADEQTSLLPNDQEDANSASPKAPATTPAPEEVRPMSWSQSLMASHSDEHNDVTSAAFLLRDAIILSKATSLFAHTDYLISGNAITGNGASGNNGCSKFSRRILTQPFTTTLLSLCIIGLVAISFLEPPSWCRGFTPYGDNNSTGGADSVLSTELLSQEEGCQAALTMQGVPSFYVDDTEDKIQYYYPSIRSDYLDAKQSFQLECIFCLFIVIHTLLCIAKDGFSLFNYLMINNIQSDKVDQITNHNMKNIRIFRIIRFVSLFFLTKGLLVDVLFESTQVRKYAIFFRLLLFISFSEGVQRELLIAIEIIPSLASVGIVLFMVIAFYGLIGVAAFYGTKEGELHFSNWVEGIWSLWTSMTTVVYPDVMMAGYNENRFVALYFITFMMFTFFFLLNVMLGVVVDGYNNSSESKRNEIEKTRSDYLLMAFEHVTKRSGLDYVTYDQLMGIFLILNEECDEIPHVPEDKANVLFALLDQDGSESLYIDEFMNFTTVMLLEFEEVKRTLIEKIFPSLAASEQYAKAKEIILSQNFDYGVDIVILINAFVVIGQSYPELAGHTPREDPKLDDGMIDTPWEWAESLFTVVYVFEMFSKITFTGLRQYSSSARNLFDAFITILAVGAMFIVYYPNDFDNTNLIRFIVMSRVIRVFRLFMVIKPFKVMSRTFIGVLPAAGRITLLLFCVIYMFAAIGMHFFGGLITRDPNNPVSSVLEGTEFADNFYWANNFNDLLSGMNVCFNLLVINNWNEMESGIIAISNKWSRYFFFFFFVCGVIIVNNLVVAIVIDFFVKEMDAHDEEEREQRGGMKKLHRSGTSLFFDGEKLPDGKHQRKYFANIRPGLTGEEQKKMLKKLIP